MNPTRPIEILIVERDPQHLELALRDRDRHRSDVRRLFLGPGETQAGALQLSLQCTQVHSGKWTGHHTGTAGGPGAVVFRQIDSSTSKKYQGTGLGLALTKRIVEARGGRVGVNSAARGGSIFYAILPRRPLQSDPCVKE